MYEQILYEVADGLATVTLNRPERLNAWTDVMGREVRHAMARAETDENVVAILITGAGRGFCAGADMQMLGALAGGGDASVSGRTDLDADPGDPSVGPSFRGQYSYFASIPKPIIAAINGPCAGMAVPISLYCDIRFASDRAKFTTSFARRGLVAEWGVSWILPRLVGVAHALDLLLSARTIDAEEAARMGLVNRVVPHDELLAFARAYATELATQCAPTSMAIIKREVYAHLSATEGDAQAEAFKLMLESFQRSDFGEGVASWMEKRPPRFEPLRTRTGQGS